MPFTEICIYQVKPQKAAEFETLMLEAKSLLEKQEGLLLLRLAKRGYRIERKLRSRTKKSLQQLLEIYRKVFGSSA